MCLHVIIPPYIDCHFTVLLVCSDTQLLASCLLLLMHHFGVVVCVTFLIVLLASFVADGLVDADKHLLWFWK